MSKFHDLAKKLQALAERGVGGEKETAARMLADLQQKHGISLEQVEQEAKTTRLFALYKDNPRYTAFVSQCIGSTTTEPCYTATRAGIFRMEAEVTHAEYLEIEAKIAFFWPIWLREEASFFSAFIQVNGLGGLPRPNSRTASPEELAEIRRKAKALDAQTLHKQVGR